MRKTILMSVLCSSSIFAQETVKPAKGPECRQDWSRETSAQYTQVAATLKDVDILFLGDSITHGWDWPANVKYPGGKEVWEKVFKPYRAYNFGISGDLTEHVQWRITEGRQLDGFQAKVLPLLIGTNNLHREGKPDSAEQVVIGIRQILDTIRTKQPAGKILLLGILPRGAAKSQIRTKIRKINSTIAQFADNKTIFYLNVNNVFLNEDDSLNNVTLRDGLHPSPKGYKELAAVLKPKIKQLLEIETNQE